MAGQRSLAAYEAIKIRAIFGYGMRAFFAILSLLLCFIASRADPVPVIKDSEAIQCVGKNAGVRGFVVFVTTAGPHSSISDETTPRSDVRWVCCG
jgi:hypothetical protein